MLFHSIDFAIFLVLVFALYWTVGRSNHKIQNWILLVSSYIFYGWWDWWVVLLLMTSSTTDYLVGQKLMSTTHQVKRKLWLLLSLGVNLGLLSYFKYFNFFIDTFVSSFTFLGFNIEATAVDIILPIGLSFYTFQTLSYTIDVYRNKVEATNDWVEFFTFVGFFPQLVAGPIERASNMLKQFRTARVFDINEAKDGMRQILWGLSKKIVVGDTCGRIVDEVFTNYSAHTASTLLMGTFLFSIQVYCDFSGYSDIAIGLGKLFNIRLRQNFNFPFFSMDIREFWSKWHISLTSWFRDYVYIPLGGNSGSKWSIARNVLVVFLISGLWHGASMSFIFFGFLNGVIYIIWDILLQKTNRNKKIEQPRQLGVPDIFNSLLTFSAFSMTLIWFRSDSLSNANDFFLRIFDSSILSIPYRFNIIVMVSVFLLFEWLQKNHKHAMEIGTWPMWSRWCTYYILIGMISYYYTFKNPFVYFQF